MREKTECCDGNTVPLHHSQSIRWPLHHLQEHNFLICKINTGYADMEAMLTRASQDLLIMSASAISLMVLFLCVARTAHVINKGTQPLSHNNEQKDGNPESCLQFYCACGTCHLDICPFVQHISFHMTMETARRPPPHKQQTGSCNSSSSPKRLCGKSPTFYGTCLTRLAQ